MGISVKDRKILWGQSGNRCAFTGCDRELIPQDIAGAGTTAVVAQEAHLVSGRLEGPRYDSTFSTENHDLPLNLILLCPTHHTLIDANNGRDFSVADLVNMKEAHELSVRARMSMSTSDRLNTEIAISTRIDSIDEILFSNFREFTLNLNHVYPYITEVMFQSLVELNVSLLGVNWPIAYPRTRSAAERIRLVLSALINHINETFEHEDNILRLPRSYDRLNEWNVELYEELRDRFRLDDAVGRLLTFELARSCNLLISAVQEELDSLYRFSDGLVLLEYGDFVFGTHVYRLEYENVDWAFLGAFPSIEEIKERIKAKGISEGIGVHEVDLFSLVL